MVYRPYGDSRIRLPASVEGLGLVDPAVGVIRSSAPAAPTWLMMAMGAYPTVGGRLAGLVARSRGTDELVTDALRRDFAPGTEVEPGLLKAHLEIEAPHGFDGAVRLPEAPH